MCWEKERSETPPAAPRTSATCPCSVGTVPCSSSFLYCKMDIFVLHGNRFPYSNKNSNLLQLLHVLSIRSKKFSSFHEAGTFPRERKRGKRGEKRKRKRRERRNRRYRIATAPMPMLILYKLWRVHHAAAAVALLTNTAFRFKTEFLQYLTSFFTASRSRISSGQYLFSKCQDQSWTTCMWMLISIISTNHTAE